MKKRLFSLVLALTMVATLFAGMTVTASAADGKIQSISSWVNRVDNTVTITPASGASYFVEVWNARTHGDEPGYGAGGNTMIVKPVNALVGRDIVTDTDNLNPYADDVWNPQNAYLTDQTPLTSSSTVTVSEECIIVVVQVDPNVKLEGFAGNKDCYAVLGAYAVEMGIELQSISITADTSLLPTINAGEVIAECFEKFIVENGVIASNHIDFHTNGMLAIQVTPENAADILNPELIEYAGASSLSGQALIDAMAEHFGIPFDWADLEIINPEYVVAEGDVYGLMVSGGVSYSGQTASLHPNIAVTFNGTAIDADELTLRKDWDEIVYESLRFPVSLGPVGAASQEPDGPSAADLSKVEAAKTLVQRNLSWIPTESDTAILEWIEYDLIPYAYDDVDYSNVTFAVTDFSVNEATYAAAGEMSCTVTITCGKASATLEIKVPMGKLIADLSSWVISMTEDKLIIDPKDETAEYFIDFTPGPFPLELYNSLKGANSAANAEQMGDIDAFYMGSSSFVGRQELPYMEEGMDLLLVTVDENIGSGDYRAITGVHAFTFVPTYEPAGDSSHEFESDIPDLKVDGLEAEAEKILKAEKDANPTASEVSVDVKMTVEAKTSNVVDANEKAKIEATASAQSNNLTYIDVVIKKTITIDGGTPSVESVNETSGLVTIEIPFDTADKSDFKVYRYHEGHADGDVQALTTTPNSNGEYIIVESGKIIVKAKFFSTYAIGYTLNSSDSSYTHICSNICYVCGGCKNAECGWYVCTNKCDEDANVFTDVAEGLWYTDSVKYVYHRDLMIGVGSDLFAPNGITTRAQIITILWRMENSPEVAIAEGFNDVLEGEWYYDAIRWASANGIAEGYGESKFGPNDAITREQLATILWRYCKYKGLDVSIGLDTNILSYEDAFDVNGWSMDAMQWACGADMIQGIAKNNTMYLDPQGAATRGQCATVIHRLCTEYKLK